MEQLYKQCFEAYYEQLHAYAFTIVKDNADAQDIVQAAFVKLWEKREQVDIAASGRSYLYTTVYHLSLNAIRNRKARKSHNEHLASTPFSTSPDAAVSKETLNKIQQAINSLPDKCREVFCKSRFEEKRYADIAAELNISVKTVEAQMGKALKILRERLYEFR